MKEIFFSLLTLLFTIIFALIFLIFGEPTMFRVAAELSRLFLYPRTIEVILDELYYERVITGEIEESQFVQFADIVKSVINR